MAEWTKWMSGLAAVAAIWMLAIPAIAHAEEKHPFTCNVPGWLDREKCNPRSQAKSFTLKPKDILSASLSDAKSNFCTTFYAMGKDGKVELGSKRVCPGQTVKLWSNDTDGDVEVYIEVTSSDWVEPNGGTAMGAVIIK